jgi:hypothetical protein
VFDSADSDLATIQPFNIPSRIKSCRSAGSGSFHSSLNCRLFYGVRNRKNCAAWDWLIGIEFENAPLPLNVPVELVAQAARGVARLVVVSKV